MAGGLSVVGGCLWWKAGPGKGPGGEEGRLGMVTSLWISHVERSLESLAVEIRSPGLNSSSGHLIGAYLACHEGLVVVGEEEASTALLIHFIAQDYLGAHLELLGIARSTIAKTYLSYLILQRAGALSASPSPNLQPASFLGCQPTLSRSPT